MLLGNGSIWAKQRSTASETTRTSASGNELTVVSQMGMVQVPPAATSPDGSLGGFLQDGGQTIDTGTEECCNNFEKMVTRKAAKSVLSILETKSRGAIQSGKYKCGDQEKTSVIPIW